MRHGLVHAGERLGTSSLTVVAISDVPCNSCEECELGGVGIIIIVRMNS